MPVDGGAAAERSAAAPAVAVIAALDFEAAPLRRHLRAGATRSFASQPRAFDAASAVVQSGPGAARAAAAAQAALAEGATALLAWGVAGALVAPLECGTVVIPRDVLAADGSLYAADPRWHAALAAALRRDFRLSEQRLLSSAAVLATPAVKARVAADSGAAAVDMESAAVAAVARARGIPFVAVRVIVDTADDALPPDAERWVDEAGNRKLAAAMQTALRPREWRALWLLARRYRPATRTLDRLAAALVTARFVLPGAD